MNAQVSPFGGRHCLVLGLRLLHELSANRRTFKSATLVWIALGPIRRTIAVMDRRRFLLGLAGGSAALVGRVSAQDRPAMAQFGVDYENAGRAIARDFIGLSYESAVVAANDFFTADNRTLLRLLRSLGPQGVLRIGGNTSERTLWRTQDTLAPRENFLITPLAINRLVGFLRALGWRLIYGLNLAAVTPEEAAAEAAYGPRDRPAASRLPDRQ
jgi:hypothetical protein